MGRGAYDLEQHRGQRRLSVDVFEILASAPRRLVLDRLADSEATAGELTDTVVAAHGLTQPAVSRHLAVLRSAGLVTVRAAGTRRVYVLRPEALRESHAWLSRYERFWTQRLDALETELARDATSRASGRVKAPS